MNIALTVPQIPIKNFPKLGTPTYTFRVEINEEACTGCGKCIVECPSRILDLVVRDTVLLSAPACTVICPASNDMRAAMRAVADQGSFEQAWRIITQTNPMPAVTGRVCHHPCESECNRTHLDAPVNINQFERSVGDYGIDKIIAFDKGKKQRKEKVAVVGVGPSGMSCAYHLARLGYQVTVFDANEKAGGMLRYGLPSYRLPDNVLDKELQRIIDLGIEVRYSTRLGKDIDLGQLRQDFNAVYLALGAQNDISLGLEGEKAPNSFSALDFLRIFAEKKAFHVGSKVTVIGGGNVAVDAARSALRCGAREVTMVCLEQRYEMPAWEREVEETIAEGIKIVNGYGPMEIITKDECITDIVFKRCTSVFDSCGCFCPTYDENDRITIATDSLVVAIGQRPDCSCLAGKDGITALASGCVEIKDAENLATSLEGVFAGGDVASAMGRGVRCQVQLVWDIGGPLRLMPICRARRGGSMNLP